MAIDQKINSRQGLRFIFSTDQELETRTLQRFLNKELVQEIMKLCLERERLNTQRPKPGGDWMYQASIDDALKQHNKKIVALVRESPLIGPFKEELLRKLKEL